VRTNSSTSGANGCDWERTGWELRTAAKAAAAMPAINERLVKVDTT
jgi:hypothetical protein